MNNFHLVNHPVAQHLLTQLRNKNTPPFLFRTYLYELSKIVGLEATRNLEMNTMEITTPLEVTSQPIVGIDLIIVSIMRAGNGMLDGLLSMFPFARAGHIGLAREDDGRKTAQYYFKLPPNIENSHALLVDPMVATGGSLIRAISLLKKSGLKKITICSLLTSPYAKERILTEYSDVNFYTVSEDRQLNQKNYILPGLGDAGDRIYGTL